MHAAHPTHPARGEGEVHDAAHNPWHGTKAARAAAVVCGVRGAREAAAGDAAPEASEAA